MSAGDIQRKVKTVFAIGLPLFAIDLQYLHLNMWSLGRKIVAVMLSAFLNN